MKKIQVNNRSDYNILKMGLYAEIWLCYGIRVNLYKSEHEKIKKFIEIKKRVSKTCYDECYGDFLELDDTHIEDKDYTIECDYYEELISNILHIGDDISVIFDACEGHNLTKTFIGVNLQCLCDTKSGHSVTEVKPLPLRDMMLLKNQSQKKYGKQLTEIANSLFPEQNIKPDIIFISDIE